METLQLHHYFKLTQGDIFVQRCDPSYWPHIPAVALLMAPVTRHLPAELQIQLNMKEKYNRVVLKQIHGCKVAGGQLEG